MEKQYDADGEIEIDLKELFFELLNNWVMIALSTVLVAVIMFCISKFILVPEYQSTSELYVLSKSTSITSLADIQMGTNLTNDYIVVVKGRPVLEQVIENLGLDETYASLKGKVSIDNPSNSRILDITVTDEDPQRAKDIADEIAKVGSAFISEKMVQDPPTIIQYGYVNENPVSPNILTNTILGAAVGAFLSMAIIIITYLMNDTIMSADDIERKLGLNVLGTLPFEEEEYDGRGRSSKKKAKAKKKVETKRPEPVKVENFQADTRRVESKRVETTKPVNKTVNKTVNKSSNKTAGKKK